VSKVGVKRHTDGVDSLDANGAEIAEASITNPVKMVRVKVELFEGK
jgi:hypothetical protein